jgi:hypothetical protein
MATTSAVTAGLLRGKPFSPGFDPRRSIGPVSAGERDFRRLLESEHLPKASALLASIYERAMAGDMQAAGLFFKVCGLIKKPNNDEEVRRMVHLMFDSAIAEARRQRDENLARGEVTQPGVRSP